MCTSIPRGRVRLREGEKKEYCNPNVLQLNYSIYTIQGDVSIHECPIHFAKSVEWKEKQELYNKQFIDGGVGRRGCVGGAYDYMCID